MFALTRKIAARPRSLARSLPASPAPAEAGVGDLLVAPTRIMLDGRKGTEIVLNNIGDAPATYRISVEFRRMTADGSLDDVTEPTPQEKAGGGHDRLRAAPSDPRAARAAVDPHRRAAAAGPARRRISRPSAVPRDSARQRRSLPPPRMAPPRASPPADPDLRRDHPGHRPARQPPGDGGDLQRRAREEGRQAGDRRSTSAARASRSTFGEVRVLQGRGQGPDRDPEGGRGLYRGRRAPRRRSRSTTHYKGAVAGPGDRPIFRDLSTTGTRRSPKPRRCCARARDRRGGIHIVLGGRKWLRKAAMLLALCAGGVGASARVRRPRRMDRGSRRPVPARRPHPPAPPRRRRSRLQYARGHMCRLRRLFDRRSTCRCGSTSGARRRAAGRSRNPTGSPSIMPRCAPAYGAQDRRRLRRARSAKRPKAGASRPARWRAGSGSASRR